MAINPLQIPNYGAPLDVSGQLSQLGQVYQKAQQDALRKQTLANLGQGDGQIDPRPLLASGDMSLAQLGVNLMNQQTQQARDARDFGFRQTEAQRAQANADRSFGLQTRTAARLENPTPAGFTTSGGGLQPIPGGPADPDYLAKKDAATAKANFSRVVEERKAAAVANGLDPSSPGYQSFVLTGKMPREDAQPLTATDKKAILEADEAISTTSSAIDGLTRAKTLSKQAFEGPKAGARGYAASFLGNSSDLGKAGAATTELDNLITTNALSQLKAVFGGMPTEGERKILLEVQGSVNLPDNVRQKIYDRAIEMAQRRLKFNQQRADALRGGTFYRKPNATSATAPAQSQGITQQQYEALPSGAVFTAPDGTQRVKP